MTMPRPINMSVDNLARAQRTMLSTAEPGTPLVLRERLRGNHPTRNTRNTRTAAQQPHEVLSNVVDGKRAHPAISGCLFHFTVDEWHPLDDLGDELVAPESVPVFLRIGGQFEYHGESGYT